MPLLIRLLDWFEYGYADFLSLVFFSLPHSHFYYTLMQTLTPRRSLLDGLFFSFGSGNPMGTGAESIVCLSVEWSTMRRILEQRLLPFVMSASGEDD